MELLPFIIRQAENPSSYWVLDKRVVCDVEWTNILVFLLLSQKTALFSLEKENKLKRICSPPPKKITFKKVAE